MKKACLNCEFWLGDEENIHSECWRFPAWALTEPKHYCGEYRLSRENTPVKEKKDYKPIYATYKGCFMDRFNLTGVTLSKKESGQLVTLGNTVGIDEACKYIEAFFANPPKWNIENKAFSPGALLGARNRFLIKSVGSTNEDSMQSYILHQLGIGDKLSKAEQAEYADFILKSGRKVQLEEWLKHE